MIVDDWSPQPGDVCVPVGKHDGTTVAVCHVSDGAVIATRHDPNRKPYVITNRLATFMQRFELVERFDPTTLEGLPT